ncbi:MAG: FtsQ-type POTRA domain-containing protein [Actinomycetaceae bacterium]|nr:FtsQ-type POTRA domain-containing protein [Actinomycetaceae bacterium]
MAKRPPLPRAASESARSVAHGGEAGADPALPQSPSPSGSAFRRRAREEHGKKTAVTSRDRAALTRVTRRETAITAQGSKSTSASHTTTPAAESVVTTALARKLEERRTKQRRRRVHVRMGLLAALVVLLIAVYAVGFSPLFALEAHRITVMGAQAPVDAASISKDLGSLEGTPLPRLDSDAIADRISAKDAWIKDVEVEKDYPHGLRIRLSVRQAVAILSDTELLASGGAVVSRPEGQGEGLVTARIDGVDAHAGRVEAARIIEALSEETRTQVSEVVVGKAGTRLVLKSGGDVEWGTSDDAQLKARVIAVLLQRQANHYDVTDPINPTTR